MANLPRGAAQCSFDTGDEYGNIISIYDVANLNCLGSDLVIANKGDCFNLTRYSQALYVELHEGSQAKVGGAFWVLKQDVTIDLEPNQTQYLCLNIDKSRQIGNRADILLKSSSEIIKGDLYGNGTVRDLPLYKIVTNSSSITDIEDLRLIVGNYYRLKESEYDALTIKEHYATYDVRED